MGNLSTKFKHIAVTALISVAPLAVVSHAAANGYGSADIGSLLAYSNYQRSAAGEASLNLNGALDAAAQAKANDMVAKNYWGHYSPTGASPWSFISAAGYSYSAAGENLAYGFASSSAVISAWMNSAEHRANLLNAGFRDVGFGIANSPNYVGTGPETIVVAEYGTPLYQPAPAPAPTYTAPSTTSTPTTSTPVASAPTDTSSSAPAVAAGDQSTPSTDTAPAPAPTAATPTPAPEQSKPVHGKSVHKAAAAKASLTTKQSNESEWVRQLRSGELAKNAKVTIPASKVASGTVLGTLSVAAALVLVGHLVVPTRVRP